MTKTIKNILKGVSSVLDICPDSRHRDYYVRTHGTNSNAIHKAFERVGNTLVASSGKITHGKTVGKEKT